jgi:hypothetical protein
MKPRRDLRQVLLPVLCVVLVLTPAFRAARPLPAELTDAEFWQLITNASEPGGGFISENLVSNELGYPYIIPSLIERVPAGGAYMGVGPEQNFSYMAAIRPSIAFIVDIRRQNMIEHLLYKAVFELSASRREFLSRLFARKIDPGLDRNATPQQLFAAVGAVPQDAELYQTNLAAIKNLLSMESGFTLSSQDESTLEHVYQEFAQQGAEMRYAVTGISITNNGRFAIQDPNGEIRVIQGPIATDNQNTTLAAFSLMLSMQFPTYAEVMTATDPGGRNWSYLVSEDSYQFVRGMQRKNLVVPLVGDFAGSKAVRAVGQYLKEHETTVSAFYVSNVEQYLTPTIKLQSFYANVATLPLNPSSTFIRSAQISGVQPGLAQSSLSPVQLALDAVMEGRARNWNDILRLTSAK